MTRSQLPKAVPTAEEWKSWLDLPETLWLRAVMAQRRQLLKDQWEAGRFSDQSQFGHAILNAKAIGACEAFTLLEELDYDKLLTELDYEQLEQPQRPSAQGEGSAGENL